MRFTDLSRDGAFYVANIPELSGAIVPIIVAGETEGGALWFWFGAENHIVHEPGGNFDFSEDADQGILRNAAGKTIAFIASPQETPEVRDAGKLMNQMLQGREHAKSESWKAWLATQLRDHET